MPINVAWLHRSFIRMQRRSKTVEDILQKTLEPQETDYKSPYPKPSYDPKDRARNHRESFRRTFFEQASYDTLVDVFRTYIVLNVREQITLTAT